MATQYKAANGRASSMPWGLTAGAGISILVTVLICMVGAWLVGSEIIAQVNIGYCSIMALLSGSILGAITAWRKIKRKKLMVCILSGAIYYSILAAITVLFFDSGFQGMGVTFVTVFIGCAVAILLTNGRVSKKRISRLGKSHR